jgi:hypothetical protein
MSMTGRFKDRYVRAGASRQHALEPWIIGDFDALSIGSKPAAQVKSERGRVIMRARMHPEAADWSPPRLVDGPIHEEPSGATALERMCQSEEREFANIGFTKIQLEQPFVSIGHGERVDLDIGTRKDLLQAIVGHQETRVPQPISADPFV